MKKRIKSTRELPKEFDLKKYDSLEKMSDMDLFRQIYRRHVPLDESLDGNWDIDLGTYYLEHGSKLPIQYDCEDPFGEHEVELPEEYYSFNGGKEFHDKYQENIDKSMRLTHGYGIGGLSRYTVMCLAEEKDFRGARKGKSLLIRNDEAKKIMELGDEYHGLLMARITDSINMVTNNNLFLEVDLDTPDEILIEDFKKLLPVWRREIGRDSVGIPINNSWGIVRKKIIEYRVLPYIDLMIWANINKFSIPHGVMAVALFPHGDRDNFMIIQTIKPFIDKLMAYESLEKLRREISL